MSIFIGSAVAIVTPYADDSIDYDSLSNLIEFHIKNATDAIVVAGTTGEASTMNEEEHREIIRFTVEKTGGRIPVIAGTGSNCTRKAVEMSRYAESVGADGLLVVTPYYNKGTQRSIIAHYKEIASNVDIPIIAYNVPGRTGMNILPATAKELSSIENIVGLKEASGDISQIAEIIRICPEDFYIYSGNDDSIVPLLSLGGKGVISVVANILPRQTHDMVESYLDGDVKKACGLQLSMNGLINALFIETNPIPIKHSMNLMGFNVGKLRLPLVPISAENEKILIDEMIKFGLKVGE